LETFLKRQNAGPNAGRLLAGETIFQLQGKKYCRKISFSALEGVYERNKARWGIGV